MALFFFTLSTIDRRVVQPIWDIARVANWKQHVLRVLQKMSWTVAMVKILGKVSDSVS